MDRMTEMEFTIVRMQHMMSVHASDIMVIKQDNTTFRAQVKSEISGLIERHTVIDERLEADEVRILARMREMDAMIMEIRRRPPSETGNSATPVHHQMSSPFGARNSNPAAGGQPAANARQSPFGHQHGLQPPTAAADAEHVFEYENVAEAADPLAGANDPWMNGRTPQFAVPQTPQRAAPVQPASWTAQAPPPAGQDGGSNGNRNPWSISKKISREINPFKGVSIHYKTWHHRMRNNWVRENTGYATLIKMIEAETSPMTWEIIKHGVMLSGKMVDLVYVATQMWSSIGDHLDDTMFDRMSQLASGEDENGVELWRRLWSDHEGGGEQVKAAGLTNLHNFPKCDRAENVTSWMSEWNACRLLHGSGLGEDHQKVMFLNKLPDAVATDIRKQQHLKTLKEIMDWLWADGARLNSMITDW